MNLEFAYRRVPRFGEGFVSSELPPMSAFLNRAHREQARDTSAEGCAGLSEREMTDEQLRAHQARQQADHEAPIATVVLRGFSFTFNPISGYYVFDGRDDSEQRAKLLRHPAGLFYLYTRQEMSDAILAELTPPQLAKRAAIEADAKANRDERIAAGEQLRAEGKVHQHPVSKRDHDPETEAFLANFLRGVGWGDEAEATASRIMRGTDALEALAGYGGDDDNGPTDKSDPEGEYFYEGDVVQLRSGGPHMTIVHFDGETLAHCAWFSPQQEPVCASFPLSSLDRLA